METDANEHIGWGGYIIIPNSPAGIWQRDTDSDRKSLQTLGYVHMGLSDRTWCVNLPPNLELAHAKKIIES